MKVSIIIPTYNTAHYLPVAIDSVLKSSFSDYEIIIIDDGSTDNTKEIIKPYVEKFPQIKYIYQKNKGLAGARNTGIENASGKYLVFLDSDDIIMPEKLKKQADFLDNMPDIDLCYSKSLNFIENNLNDTFPADFPVFEGNVLKNLWYGNFMHVNSVMVVREKVNAVGNFNPAYRELEDWDLWLRMAIAGSKFAYINERLSMVRVRKTSMTVNQSKMDKAMVKVLQNILSVLKSDIKLYSENKLHYWKALSLFMIKSDSDKFIKTQLKAIIECGLRYFLTAAKVCVKKAVKPILPNQNKTTHKLESIWNG